MNPAEIPTVKAANMLEDMLVQQIARCERAAGNPAAAAVLVEAQQKLAIVRARRAEIEAG